ncbi:MAG: amidase [Verrucomicrobia bacterium]|nr:amidase [Verrucomicrobiota bacterium]
MNAIPPGLCLAALLWTTATWAAETNTVTRTDLAGALRVAGLPFTDAEQSQMLPSIERRLTALAELRGRPFPNALAPAFTFDPRPPGFLLPRGGEPVVWEPPAMVSLPENREVLAFASVAELAALIRARKITSLELTELSLARLKRHGPTLHCVVTLTEERGRAAARRADAEIGSGRWRGPLHGIPYGAKDLLATAETPTTWGASPFTNQMFASDATVIRRLEEAGAVLVAKLSLGELAMGDTWFGGLTRNPWQPDKGSSGSSAGSAAAVAAGLVPFALGSETLGSIVSPATVCGVTGLRPTFGRISRTGAMTLCWTLDKLGPLARSAEDCALILDAIRGPDGQDTAAIAAPFRFDVTRPLKSLRLGVLQDDLEGDTDHRTNHLAALEVLRGLGAELRPVILPDLPSGPLWMILEVEAAAAFDQFTRDNRDDQLVQQGPGNWPNLFRSAHLIPAVDYVQASRLRTELMAAMSALLRDLDVLIAPAWAGNALLFSNMSGHPCVVVPTGDKAGGAPVSLCFLGGIFDEGSALEAAAAYQRATAWHRQRPPQFAP